MTGFFLDKLPDSLADLRMLSSSSTIEWYIDSPIDSDVVWNLSRLSGEKADWYMEVVMSRRSLSK